jgi:hypothetical protein
MDVAPIIVNNRTYLPARFVAESLGYKVSWNQETETVLIIDEATQQLKDEMYNLLRDDCGIIPTEQNVEWAVSKYHDGYSKYEIVKLIRQTPEFQARYPGIRDDQSPQEWDELVAQLNEASLKYRGQPFDPWNNPEDLAVLTGQSN